MASAGSRGTDSPGLGCQPSQRMLQSGAGRTLACVSTCVRSAAVIGPGKELLTCTRLPKPLLCNGWCVPRASLSRLLMAVGSLAGHQREALICCCCTTVAQPARPRRREEVAKQNVVSFSTRKGTAATQERREQVFAADQQHSGSTVSIALYRLPYVRMCCFPPSASTWPLSQAQTLRGGFGPVGGWAGEARGRAIFSCCLSMLRNLSAWAHVAVPQVHSMCPTQLRQPGSCLTSLTLLLDGASPWPRQRPGSAAGAAASQAAGPLLRRRHLHPSLPARSRQQRAPLPTGLQPAARLLPADPGRLLAAAVGGVLSARWQLCSGTQRQSRLRRPTCLGDWLLCRLILPAC